MIIYTDIKNNLRISLLTSRILRTEKGTFCDLPTQTVQNRDFGEVKYRLSEEGKYIFVQTPDAGFKVRISDGKVVYATMPPHCYTKNPSLGTLPGTARTLDMANGAVKLERGVVGRFTSVMDDSKSLVIMPDGSIAPRGKCSDRYWFVGYESHLDQLRDFFKLTGEVPLIPKYALGNWWSRYRAYTQEEYRALMQRFIDEELPITVATIDMDWHWTDVIDRFGKDAKSKKPKCLQEALYYFLLQGWTGYSWNTELFPDHRELLSWLHEMGFMVTLNIHPSQGVRFFEDGYEEMCRRLGIDPERREVIDFDVTDKEFMRAYFEVLHHSLEREGVDFWWIDWQQGKKTKTRGLDPLWALNHEHYLDSDKGEARPLILSRYAGLGSHRYPLGFSGDTIVSWKSLDFQPYFTSSAANAGYTWWSHDIGGHMKGIQDDELYVRWLQLGVFSPINRLHSSNSDFMGKEPWKRSYSANKVANEFLRLRHKLIPYLYTANYRTHTEGEPICMPMYYKYSWFDTYKAKNQYIFGGQLLVAPITAPADKRLNLASVRVWLPEGRWTDIFCGRVYKGGGWVTMYRDIDTIPVLAPSGAIIPMYENDRTNDLSLDQPLEIHIWRGDGEYVLYEDDGLTKAYRRGEYARTRFSVRDEGGTLLVTAQVESDEHGILPAGRKVTLKFRDIVADDVEITLSSEPVTIELKDYTPRTNGDRTEKKNEILTRVQGRNAWKNRVFGAKGYPKFVADALAELDALV